MAVSSYWYINGMKELVNGNVALTGANAFRVALLGSAYALNVSKLQSDNLFSAISGGNQITGTGYTAGGQNLTLAAATNSAGDVRIGTAIPDTTWTEATFTARYAVVYHNASSTLMGIVDFGQDESCSNGSFTIDWDDVAIFQITPETII